MTTITSNETKVKTTQDERDARIQGLYDEIKTWDGRYDVTYHNKLKMLVKIAEIERTGTETAYDILGRVEAKMNW